MMGHLDLLDAGPQRNCRLPALHILVKAPFKGLREVGGELAALDPGGI